MAFMPGEEGTVEAQSGVLLLNWVRRAFVWEGCLTQGVRT